QPRMNTDGHGWPEGADRFPWDLALGTCLEFGVWDLVFSEPLSSVLSPLLRRGERKKSSAPGQRIRVHPCPSVVQRFVFVRVHSWSHLMALMSERMGRKIDTAMVPTNITRNTISAGSTIAKMAFTRRGTMSW